MKQKKNSAIILICLLISASLSTTALAEDNYVIQTVGNVTYEVPSDWTSTADVNDKGTTINYSEGTTTFTVTFSSTDLSEISLPLQYFMLETAYESFEEFEEFGNFSEYSFEKSTFEEYASITPIFTYDFLGFEYTSLANIMYTGEGIASFVLSIPTFLLSEDDYNIFSEISASIKLATSSEPNISEGTIHIANIELELPTEWIYHDTTVDGDSTFYIYTTGEETLQIITNPYDEDLAPVSDLLVGSMADAFETLPAYSEITSTELTISGRTAQFDSCFAVFGDTYSSCIDICVNTGTHIIDFLYLTELGNEEIGLDSMLDMVTNLKIIDVPSV